MPTARRGGTATAAPEESLAASGEGDAAVYILGYTNFPTDVARKGPVAPIREASWRKSIL